MQYPDWTVDLTRQSATHKCGFVLRVEGNPASPSGVIPHQYPDGMSVVEQVRLLRIGIEAIAASAKAMTPANVESNESNEGNGKKAPKIVISKAKAELTGRAKSKSKRPTLTLKK